MSKANVFFYRAVALVTTLAQLSAFAAEGHVTSTDKTVAATYGCESQLTDDVEQDLIAETQQIDAKHFEGRTKVADINLASTALETRLNPNHDPAIALRLNQERNLIAVADTNKFLLSLLVKRMSGESSALSADEKKILLDRGVPKEVVDNLDATLNELKTAQLPSFNALKKAGVSFDKKSLTWDFSDAHLNANDFVADGGKPTAIATALDNLVGLGLAKNLGDPNRMDAVIMGDKVFLPPNKKEKSGYKLGNLNVMSLDQWNAAVDKSLDRFKVGLSNFATASKAGSSIRDLRFGGNLTGKKTKASEQQVGNKSIAQVSKDAAYLDLLGNEKILVNSLGVSADMRKTLGEAIQHANKVDAANLTGAVAQLDSDIKLAQRTRKVLLVSAGLATGGVLLGAVAGGAAVAGGGATLATLGTAATTTSSVATATGFMLTTPTLITAGTSAARAMIDKDGQGGSLFCRFRSQYEKHAVGAVYMGSALSIVPGAAATGGGLFSIAGMPLAGLAVQGGINFTAGGVLTGSAAISGTKSLLGCYSKFRQARALIHKTADSAAATDDDVKKAHALNKAAQEECVDAGVNLATVAMSTKGLSREGLKTLDIVYQKSPGFRDFANNYVPFVKTIKAGMPLTAYEASLKATKAETTPVSKFFERNGADPANGASAAEIRKTVEAEAGRQEQGFKDFMESFSDYARNVFRVQKRPYVEQLINDVQGHPLQAAEAAKAGLTFRDLLEISDHQYFAKMAPKPTAPGPLGAAIGKIRNPTTMAITAAVARTTVGAGKFGWGLLYFGTIIGTFNSAVSSVTNPINNKATQISNVVLAKPSLTVAGWMADSAPVIDVSKANKVVKEAEELTGARRKFKFDGADPDEVARWWVQMQKDVLKINQEVTNILPGNVNGIRGFDSNQINEGADLGSQLTANVLAYSVHETQVMELTEKIAAMNKAGTTPPDSLVHKLQDEKEYMSYAGDAVGGVLVKQTMNELFYPDSHRDPYTDNGQEVRLKAFNILRNQAGHYPDYLKKFAPQTQAIFDQLDLRVDVLKRAVAQQQTAKK